MWESISSTLTSKNGPSLLITIAVLILIIVILAIKLGKAGLLNIHTKHINIGSKVSERELIRRQIEVAHEFIMSIEIKLAPDLEEITREGNVFSCEFNNMNIKWCIAHDCNDISKKDEENLKMWLQNAIAFSGKTWQLPFLLNQNLPFTSEVYVNGEKVEYPKC